MLKTDPTFSYYAPTASKAGSANLAVTNAATDYIVGRGSLASLKTAISNWRSGVGNRVRSEYLKSLEKFS